jgi:hypothetical protein
LSAYSSSERILSLADGSYDKITVAEGEKQAVLALQDKRWVLPGSGNFPAAESKVNTFVSTLTSLTKSYPRGRTKIAAKQLKVAPDGFERKIVFQKGDQPAVTVYLGTSPSFRKVHLRVEQQDAIYAVSFNAFDAPAKDSDWFDPNILQVKRDDIERVEYKGYVLEKKDDAFVVSGVKEGEETDAGEANALITRLAGLGYMEQLGTEAKDEYNLKDPAVEYLLHTKDGRDLMFTAGQPAEKDYYVAKCSAYPYYFKVAKTVVDPIKDAALNKLVRPKGKPAEKGAEAAAEAVKPAAEVPAQNEPPVEIVPEPEAAGQ